MADVQSDCRSQTRSDEVLRELRYPVVPDCPPSAAELTSLEEVRFLNDDATGFVKRNRSVLRPVE